MDTQGIIAGDIHAWAEVAGVQDALAHAPHCATCRCDAPVCDHCGKPVFMTGALGWQHADGFYGCDLSPYITRAEVNGLRGEL
jgi:hypothetical protein